MISAIWRLSHLVGGIGAIMFITINDKYGASNPDDLDYCIYLHKSNNQDLKTSALFIVH